MSTWTYTVCSPFGGRGGGCKLREQGWGCTCRQHDNGGGGVNNGSKVVGTAQCAAVLGGLGGMRGVGWYEGGWVV
jgi:hypothetical protein